MSTSSSQRWRVGAAAVAAVALLLFPLQAITVRPARGGGLLWAVPAGAGAEFSLTWIHSVNRRPVTETYRIGDGRRLRLVAMAFDHYGPNLPHAPEPGTTWQIGPDRILVTGYDRALPRLDLGVAPDRHRLQIGRVEWDLVAGAGSGRSLRLAVERLPVLVILLVEVRQWPNTRILP